MCTIPKRWMMKTVNEYPRFSTMPSPFTICLLDLEQHDTMRFTQKIGSRSFRDDQVLCEEAD